MEAGSAVEVWRGDVRCLARVGDRVYAGTNGAGLLRSDDDGATWRAVGLTGVAVRSIGADGERIVVGAQPVAVHCSDDGGALWRPLESFPRRPYWWQPATPPHTEGYVSALAVRGDTILAGIEAFRGFRSVDAGGSWLALRRGFTLDCHALVLMHGRAYEGAGFGPSWSVDGGTSWRPPRAGLDRRYVMAIAVDPADADCWYAAAAPLMKAHSRDSHAYVFRWSDGRWSRVSESFATFRMPLPVRPQTRLSQVSAAERSSPPTTAARVGTGCPLSTACAAWSAGRRPPPRSAAAAGSTRAFTGRLLNGCGAVTYAPQLLWSER